jgi:hypothetical protein
MNVKGKSTREILKDEIKLESERTAIDKKVENSQMSPRCTGTEMISQEFDIKTEDVAAYLQSQDFAVAHLSTAVRTQRTAEESVMVDTKNVNTPVVSQENYYPLKRTLLMEDVVKELKPKSKQIKRSQDTDKELIVLQTEKIRKFIPTEMFVFETKTIKLARDTKDSNKGRQETNSSKTSIACQRSRIRLQSTTMRRPNPTNQGFFRTSSSVWLNVPCGRASYCWMFPCDNGIMAKMEETHPKIFWI